MLNSSFFVPLAVGDVVQVECCEGREVVTAYLHPGDKILSVVLVDSVVSDSEQTDVTESWRALGAQWTEGSRGLLLTVWQGPSADDVFDRLVRDVGDRDGWHTPLVYGPDDRALEAAVFFGSGQPVERPRSWPPSTAGNGGCVQMPEPVRSMTYTCRSGMRARQVGEREA